MERRNRQEPDLVVPVKDGILPQVELTLLAAHIRRLFAPEPGTFQWGDGGDAKVVRGPCQSPRRHKSWRAIALCDSTRCCWPRGRIIRAREWRAAAASIGRV